MLVANVSVHINKFIRKKGLERQLLAASHRLKFPDVLLLAFHFPQFLQTSLVFVNMQKHYGEKSVNFSLT